MKMLYQMNDVTVSLGAEVILSHINFEIHGTEKIAVVGANGAGKTTLLKTIAGELTPDRDDKRQTPGILCARKLLVTMHQQNPFVQKEGEVDTRTVEQVILSACGADEFSLERFSYEKEYDRLLTGFGFSLEDKKKTLDEFSGGEQTKIALIQRLLEQPDILLLDEPTNHLDMETCLWLEDYLKSYPKAVVMVSHDRYFLDRVADVVYELERKKLTRYPGNYTEFKAQKRKLYTITIKAYERQQEEIKRLEELIERFKHKPKKAAFARSRKKIIERMEKIEKPVKDEAHIFTGEIVPLELGSKWVLEAEHLKIGYTKALLEMGLRIKRGQKIGIIGPNGAGKTTFLKTIAGYLPKISGKCTLGNGITLGYFDQQSAQISSEKTVYEHFHELYPALSEKEARAVLGSYLFKGAMTAKRVSDLSGGEKSRLVLCELLYGRPNFLVLDEPTNHMDVAAKETLESAFKAYKGTIIFVSHDRYFIRQVAESILIFENSQVSYYPFGYDHYVERRNKVGQNSDMAALRLAEEQAMIADMRSVPEPEKHRLKEISTEAAYVDWKLRLAGEKLESVRKPLEICCEHIDAATTEEGYDQALLEYQMADKAWHEACLSWYDLYLELEINDD